MRAAGTARSTWFFRALAIAAFTLFALSPSALARTQTDAVRTGPPATGGPAGQGGGGPGPPVQGVGETSPSAQIEPPQSPAEPGPTVVGGEIRGNGSEGSVEAPEAPGPAGGGASSGSDVEDEAAAENVSAETPERADIDDVDARDERQPDTAEPHAGDRDPTAAPGRSMAVAAQTNADDAGEVPIPDDELQPTDELDTRDDDRPDGANGGGEDAGRDGSRDEGAGPSTAAAATGPAAGLPRTGFEAPIVALLGLLLMAVGIGLRQLVQNPVGKARVDLEALEAAGPRLIPIAGHAFRPTGLRKLAFPRRAQYRPSPPAARIPLSSAYPAGHTRGRARTCLGAAGTLRSLRTGRG